MQPGEHFIRLRKAGSSRSSVGFFRQAGLRDCHQGFLAPYRLDPRLRNRPAGGICMEEINYLAAAAAAVSTFVIGGLWYSPLLFHRAWARANGFTEADLAKGGTGKIFGIAFALALVMSF